MNSPSVPDLPADAAPTSAENRRGWPWIAALIILAMGIFVRLYPTASFSGVGFDEVLYREYVLKLDKTGLLEYPAVGQMYLEDQRKPDVIAKLPPTRFLYIYCSWVWKSAFFGDAPAISLKAPGAAEKDPALISLHRISALFTCLLLTVSGVFLWRAFPIKVALTAFALIACAPTQIHMAQHALVDGFFAFWATLCLWLLWECLQKPDHPVFLTAYGLALALMVITKENSFFVFIALCAIIAANRWLQCGKVTPSLLVVSFFGPLLGVVVLLNLAGGFEPLIDIYKSLVSKAHTLDYAIKTGDGPWHRYLVDIMVVSPLVLCLAIGGLFSGLRAQRPLLFLSAFVVFSYAVMCNVKYGMNLRYATIWELPLCALAAVQLYRVTPVFGQKEKLAATVLTIGLCAYSLRQYVIFCVDHPLYELASGLLLQAVKILK